jgi:hypothetical protein
MMMAIAIKAEAEATGAETKAEDGRILTVTAIIDRVMEGLRTADLPTAEVIRTAADLAEEDHFKAVVTKWETWERA